MGQTLVLLLRERQLASSPPWADFVALALWACAQSTLHLVLCGSVAF